MTASASALDIYLQNHEAAARAGADLFGRVSRAQRHRPYAAELRELRDEVVADLRTIRDLMAARGIRPNSALGVCLQIGERVGRLKPNGALVRRMPLSDLIEIEALTDAVHAKLAGWRALSEAGFSDERLAGLVDRAEAQADRLWVLHGRAAAVLRPDTFGQRPKSRREA